MRQKKTAAALLAALCLVWLGGCGSRQAQTGAKDLQAQGAVQDAAQGTAQDAAQDAAPGTVQDAVLGTERRSVTVNSSETVSVEPDRAEVVYSIRTEASTAADCQQRNAEASAQVIETLRGLGIEEHSIQTSDFSMNPVYRYSDGQSRITGYEAVTTLTVSDLEIDGLGEFLSRSVASGVNTVQSITYQASGYDQGYQEALGKAVDRAHQKAEALASASGAKVGRVLEIQETSAYTQARYADAYGVGQQNALSEQKLSDKAAPMEAMPGEIAVCASVTVEYELTD